MSCINEQEISLSSLETKILNGVKYLGLFVDHINFVLNKLSRFCGLLYRMRTVSYRELFLFNYNNSFIKTVIQYGILVYGCTNESKLSSIVKTPKNISDSFSLKVPVKAFMN